FSAQLLDQRVIGDLDARRERQAHAHAGTLAEMIGAAKRLSWRPALEPWFFTQSRCSASCAHRAASRPSPAHAADNRVALDRVSKLSPSVGPAARAPRASRSGSGWRPRVPRAPAPARTPRVVVSAHSRFAPHRGRPYHTSSAFERSLSRGDRMATPREFTLD